MRLLIKINNRIVTCPRMACKLSKISLASTSMSANILGCRSFNMKFLSEKSGEEIVLTCLNAKILKMNLDLIVGLPDLRKYGLVSHLTTFFGITREVNHDHDPMM